MMKNKIAILCILMMFISQAWAYEKNLTKWEEVSRPKDKLSADARIWGYAANYSNNEWRVSTKDLVPIAELMKDYSYVAGEKPEFQPKAEKFTEGHAFLKVEDGWLIGFNKGEWGGALYWFSFDGKKNYKISGHQIVAFLDTADGIIAIEGLAHLGLSKGSIIKIYRDSAWKTETIFTLPQAPETATILRNGSFLIVLSDSLVTYSKGIGLKTLISDAEWGGLYPNSIVLSNDNNKAYIGMRQFVAEYDIKTNSLRFLIPDKSFLNKLKKETEEQIRKQYGG